MGTEIVALDLAETDLKVADYLAYFPLIPFAIHFRKSNV
jgi:hypothetical protein